MNDKAIIVLRQEGHTRRTRYQQLWFMAESMMIEKAQLEIELDALASRIQSEVLPLELELAYVSVQALERLLLFSERKTLGKGYRSALSPWIDELLVSLLDINRPDDSQLDRIARHHATVGACKGACKGHFNSAMGTLFDRGGACRTPEERDECYRQEFLQATEPDHEDERHSGSAPCAGVPSSSVADGAVFQRLFRQAAAALHPDKEPIEEKRHEKHDLMTRLLQARRENDLITLLLMHDQYAEADSALSGADEQQLEGVLVQHLVVLQKQKDALADKSPLHCMAYHYFHDKDMQTVDARIAEQIAVHRQRRQALETFLEEVRTLKQLMARLPLRYVYMHCLW